MITNELYYGPTLEYSESIHAQKYRPRGEGFIDMCNRISGALGDSEEHRRAFRAQLLNMSFLPGGRIQLAVGSPRRVTAFNCYLSRDIEDTSEAIMDAAKEAFLTQRMGGGIGYNFSTIRPRGAWIKSTDSPASGPCSFMRIFNEVCSTVSSGGARRGAQMAVLNVDHPDIEEFIAAKRTPGSLTNFNMSVGITNEFMEAVLAEETFDLKFNDKIYSTVDAKALWEDIMRSTWDYAEPGVLFLDTINTMNNLYYCETINATNPCGEQPLPAYGACLLGSFNVVKYLKKRGKNYVLDFATFERDIPAVVRAMDNVIDSTIYPLPEQEEEAKQKRRIGLGVTGVANALEACGHSYGSDSYLRLQSKLLRILRDGAYTASAHLAKEKGSFPLYESESYLQGSFVKSLPKKVRELIEANGIRNSHLLSIAPTGTISITADNVSSGIEPPFSLAYSRAILQEDGTTQTTLVTDYGHRELGVRGKTAGEVSVEEHVAVLASAQKYVDSAVSKTCNVGDDVTYERFKEVYMLAWKSGSKGCTTFRAAGKKAGILVETPVVDGAACTIDFETGERSCE